MATTFGKASNITIATNDISPYVNSVTFKQSNDVEDITTFGSSAHKYAAALADGEMTIAGLWDKTATVGSYTVIQPLVGDSDGAAFVWCPEGATSGNVQYSGTIILQDYTESAPVADLVSFTATFKISGTVTVGTVSS